MSVSPVGLHHGRRSGGGRTVICAGLAGLLAFAPSLAAAHGAIPVSPEDVWSRWEFDPLVSGSMLLAHWLYGRGVLAAWRHAGRGRVVTYRNIAFFIAGEIALVIALMSPLDPLGDTLLSAHMGQHMMLVAIAPPLLMLGAPRAVFTYALSPGLRRSAWVRGAGRIWSAAARPWRATALHGLVLWAWHAPVLFDAAVRDEGLHTFEHVSFFISALLFWDAVLKAGRRPASAGVAALAVFVTFVHGGMLGGVLTLAVAPLYDAYIGRTAIWGMTVLADQQLAGVIMWVPIGLVYFAATLTFAAKLIPQSLGPTLPSAGGALEIAPARREPS